MITGIGIDMDGGRPSRIHLLMRFNNRAMPSGHRGINGKARGTTSYIKLDRIACGSFPVVNHKRSAGSSGRNRHRDVLVREGKTACISAVKRDARRSSVGPEVVTVYVAGGSDISASGA